ncbi:MAG: hypothetical protein Q8Q14_05465 [Gemmatimonadales bacterium]|nr:hypothetical protein [Gemmatimonadales bacterium]
MLLFFTLLGWLAHAGVARQAPPPDVLHCRIELAAGAASGRCSVAAPAGRAILRCGDADRQAGHCAAAGKGRYVAWVVGTGPGRCRITDKKTKWKRGIVSAKLSKSAGGPSTCDLYVELR